MKKIILLSLALITWSASYLISMEETDQKSPVLAFVADTQAPMWIEGVFLRKDNNPAATKKILSEILKSHPTTLYMLGDVVSLGLSNRAWVIIDYYLKEFEQLGIPVYGILGNHELMQRPGRGERNFQKYFPAHVRTGYVNITDSVAVVLLNSNASSLTAADLVKQSDWYRKTLGELDTDPSVKAVIVCCHHSPFTNSRLVKSSKFVQEEFVPYFLKSEKARLFLSGHAHLFEHYKYQDKDFLVIGGGGGLSHPVSSSVIRLPDLAVNYKPLFHYLTVTRSEEYLEVTSHRLLPDMSGFNGEFTFTIPIKGRKKD